MLTPIQLQAVREVVVTGSLRTAAKRLGFTPSAISQQISSLERTLGVQLFERSPRSVRPTAAGAQLARKAARLLADLEAAEDEMRSFATAHRGRLHLGSFWSAGFRLLPAVLAEFLRDRPQVDVRYEEGDPEVTIPAVVEGRLDLAVVFEYGMVPHTLPKDLDMTLILEEPLYVLVPTSHRLAGRKRIQFGELSAERWISYSEGRDAARNLTHICAAGGFHPDVLFRTNDYNLPFELVRKGLGVAIVPELAMIESHDVHVFKLGNPAHVRRVFAVRRTADPNPLFSHVISRLRTAAEALDRRTDLPTALSGPS
ncbi:LysR substrate-binding domain-containing protein [Nonomuraea sp. NPDC000554]|uniref:LysR family transcriptional regulator n=1 Tax=Nonomuraea sp. NPDC000554 TaxID=3154259 RepID=UPI00331E6DA8